MRKQLVEKCTTAPFTMLWALESREFAPIKGSYDPDSQRWTGSDITAVETWSRSTTTGVINSDPDEDKDD